MSSCAHSLILTPCRREGQSKAKCWTGAFACTDVVLDLRTRPGSHDSRTSRCLLRCNRQQICARVSCFLRVATSASHQRLVQLVLYRAPPPKTDRVLWALAALVLHGTSMQTKQKEWGVHLVRLARVRPATGMVPRGDLLCWRSLAAQGHSQRPSRSAREPVPPHPR